MELNGTMSEEERKKFDVVDDLKKAVFNLRTEIESKDKKHASLIKMASKNLAQLAVQASRITELEGQRDELVEACKELIIESANNITNEGRDGIEANKDDIDLIEKVTGEIWQEI